MSPEAKGTIERTSPQDQAQNCRTWRRLPPRIVIAKICIVLLHIIPVQPYFVTSLVTSAFPIGLIFPLWLSASQVLRDSIRFHPTRIVMGADSSSNNRCQADKQTTGYLGCNMPASGGASRTRTAYITSCQYESGLRYTKQRPEPHIIHLVRAWVPTRTCRQVLLASLALLYWQQEVQVGRVNTTGCPIYVVDVGWTPSTWQVAVTAAKKCCPRFAQSIVVHAPGSHVTRLMPPHEWTEDHGTTPSCGNLPLQHLSAPSGGQRQQMISAPRRSFALLSAEKVRAHSVQPWSIYDVPPPGFCTLRWKQPHARTHAHARTTTQGVWECGHPQAGQSMLSLCITVRGALCECSPRLAADARTMRGRRDARPAGLLPTGPRG